MIGPYVNGATLFFGGLAGAFLGQRIGQGLRNRMPMVFGCSSMGLGVAMIVKVKLMAPVILALIVGYLIGELLHLEAGILKAAGSAKRLVERFASSSGEVSQEEFKEKFVAILVLFCASSTGIYGAMSEGMTGDPTLLVVKGILDLFTAAVFAASLGYCVSLLVVPQFVIQAALYLGSACIMPLTTPDMLADFQALGGLILLATGFRICGIKPFPVGNMTPALFLVMPLSALWARYLG